MRGILCAAVSALLVVFASAQVETFRQTFNAPSNHADTGVAAVALAHGINVVAGSGYSSVTGTYSGYVVAYDLKGTALWTLTRSAIAGNIKPEQLARGGGSDDVWMASRVNVAGVKSVRVTRMTASGSIVFEQDIPAGNSVEACALAVDNDGNAYIADDANSQPFVAKIGPLGQILWITSLTGGAGAEGTAVSVEASGNVYTAGIRKFVQGGTFAAKLSPSGAVLWNQFDPGQIGNALGPSFLALHGSNVLVLSNPESTFGVPQYRLRRLASADGSAAWAAYYKPSPQNDAEATGLAVDRAGNAFVSAFRIVPSSGIVVKYSPTGSRLWEANPTERTDGLVADPYGGVVVCSHLGTIRRYDPLGALTYTRTRTADVYNAITTDSRTRLLVTGSAFGGPTNSDFVSVGVYFPVRR